jgi:hypothetical protein
MPRKYHKKPKAAPVDHPRFFEGLGLEELPEGWELLYSGEDQQKKWHFTAERVAQNKERYEALVQAIGMGAPADLICRVFKVHHRTLAAIAVRDKSCIDDIKKSTGELMLKAAGLSVSSYLQDLMAGTVDPKTKSIAAGIFSQNGLLLLGQATAIVEHGARPELTVDAVNGFWERLKRVKEAQAGELPAAGDSGSVAKEEKDQ